MLSFRIATVGVSALALLAAVCLPDVVGVAQSPDSKGVNAVYRQTVSQGVAFLLERGQDRSDGSFSKQLGPAITALCVSALLDHDVPVNNPQIARSLEYLKSMIQPDGGIYAADSTLRNYETSVALMCFQRINDGGQYDDLIQNALKFLKGLQWDEGEQHERQSAFYGGQGYGKHKRPDASNTSFFMDALQAAGEDADSEAVQKALVFMSRCQNLSTEHNSAEFASAVTAEDQGGFIYSPVGKGESKAGETPEGGLRSYASMTYAGLKSLLYAGVEKDDIRVQAALDWIGRHYDLNNNPGMGQQGLYYYFHVLAKTLAAAEVSEISTVDGNQHDWRSDLVVRLAELQTEDGSWTNSADRWYEGDPNLVTSFALLALGYCER